MNLISLTKKVASVVVVTTLMLPAVAVSASPLSKYNAWKHATQPIVSKMLKDYSALEIGLNNNNLSASRAAAHALANDAIVLNRHSNSPDYTLNSDTNVLAVALSSLASTTLLVLGNGASLAQFKASVITFTHATETYTSRLVYDNKRY